MLAWLVPHETAVVSVFCVHHTTMHHVTSYIVFLLVWTCCGTAHVKVGQEAITVCCLMRVASGADTLTVALLEMAGHGGSRGGHHHDDTERVWRGNAQHPQCVTGRKEDDWEKHRWPVLQGKRGEKRMYGLVGSNEKKMVGWFRCVSPGLPSWQY